MSLFAVDVGRRLVRPEEFGHPVVVVLDKAITGYIKMFGPAVAAATNEAHQHAFRVADQDDQTWSETPTPGEQLPGRSAQ